MSDFRSNPYNAHYLKIYSISGLRFGGEKASDIIGKWTIIIISIFQDQKYKKVVISIIILSFYPCIA
jgi:hypothetical protein